MSFFLKGLLLSAQIQLELVLDISLKKESERQDLLKSQVSDFGSYSSKLQADLQKWDSV